MRLALVVLEEHARAAVQLRDDDTLGAVDDEGAVVGHERHFAHVDLLLLDLLDRLGLRRFTVIDDHLQLGAHGRGIGQAALLALTRVEGRLGHVELDELHLHEAVVRHDREGGEEGGLQPLGLALGGWHVLLQERDVRLPLHRQQVGDVENALALAEALANPLALGVAVGRVDACAIEHSVVENACRPSPRSSATGCSDIASDAWWLATTSRWRTTQALHRSPTKPVLCSRIREH